MDIMAEAMGAALADDLDISDSDDEDGGGGEGGGNNDQESQTSYSHFVCEFEFEMINSILRSPAGHRRQDGGGARGSSVGARAPAAGRGRHLVLGRLGCVS